VKKPAPAPAPAAAEPRAGSLLVDWANAQDHWIREIVAELASARKELSERRVDHFYERLLREKELAPGEKPQAPPLDAGIESGPREKALTLVALRDVRDVNALAGGQEIAFNPRMTVLFGENAAGKTGYVRILKRIAGVRTAEAVLGNVTAGAAPAAAPEAAPAEAKPSAVVEYELEGKRKTYEWRNEAGVAPFTRIDVLDTRGTLVHVDQELTYVYTPSELTLFALVHQAIERVRARLEAARAESQPEANPFVARFPRESPFFAKVEGLGASTDLASLRALADVAAADEAGLAALRERVAALRTGTADARLQLAVAERDQHQAFMAVIRAIGAFDPKAYGAALGAFLAARERQARATKEAFAGSRIPGVLTEAWRGFVEAADRYGREVEGKAYATFPAAGRPCPYCREPLGEAAVALLAKYREFCASEARQAVEETRKALAAAVGALPGLDLEGLRALIEKRLAAIPEATERPATLAKLVDLCQAARRAQEAVRAEAPFPDASLPALARETAQLFEERLKAVTALVSDLGREAEDRKRSLEREEARLRELEGRLALRAIFPEVERWVERTQWADRAGAVLGRMKSVSRSLTEASKQASERLLNHNFEELFQRECRLLAAPAVTVEFPGRKGQPARRKTLADHRLSEILSEGEQKALGLADFLAESLLRAKSSPVVFDDPVNSLDYKRLKHVVDRLVELSRARQVIVFTHNIWFTMEILSRFEHDRDACSFYEVSAADGRRGVVARGTHPRADTPSSLRARLNQLIQDARAAGAGPAQAALVEKGYEVLRALCEVFVEQELLQGVSQRYHPNVVMSRLPKIRAARLPGAIDAVVAVYDRACRAIASHAQPLETLNVRPSLADLEADWARVQEAREGYLKG